MVRLLLRLLKITDFEVCASCKTLKEQLEFERSEKKELLDSLLRITNPKVIEAPTQEVQPIRDSAVSFSRRRAALEMRDRMEAKTLADSQHIGRPDIPNNPNKIQFVEVPKREAIEKLEEELGVSENQVNIEEGQGVK